MDEEIARIVEVERQCSADVEQAELEYRKNLEAHKRLLEEKKTRERTRIVAKEKTRLTQAVEEAKNQTEAASAALRRDIEDLFHNPALNEAIKKEIISILLMR
ncbi:MAG: hypothetical protein AB2L11_03120 [Syntrophobacteraceae bacterium]